MFRIGGDLWRRDVLGARPIRLGQQVCTINGCGEATDRDKAKAYATLLDDTITNNPDCFEGEDLTSARALLSKLDSFLNPPPFAKVLGVTTLSDDEMKIVATATGCKAVKMIKPGPDVHPGVTTGRDTTKPGSIPLTTAEQSQQAPAGAAVTQDQTSIVPLAIGAAVTLAIIYALVD